MSTLIQKRGLFCTLRVLYKSLPSSFAFFSICFTVCTKRLLWPLDCGYNGLDVVNLIFHSLANWWILCLHMAYCHSSNLLVFHVAQILPSSWWWWFLQTCLLSLWFYDIYCNSPLPEDNRHFEMFECRIQLSAMVFLALGVVVVVLSAIDFGVSGIWDISPRNRQCLVQFLVKTWWTWLAFWIFQFLYGIHEETLVP